MGAMGVMQLEPPTARELGFNNVSTDASENIHAGAKYMAELRDRYFNEPRIMPVAKLHLTLAAYNAGPENVGKWRRIAESRGMDSDKWLGSVERISLEHAGEQTYQYVRNIDKYFVAYVEAQQLQREREADIRDLKN
jgi:membrane-bound lytic murein transglycosylase MltF